MEQRSPRPEPGVYHSAQALAQPGHIQVPERKPQRIVLEIFQAQKPREWGPLPHLPPGALRGQKPEARPTEGQPGLAQVGADMLSIGSVGALQLAPTRAPMRHPEIFGGIEKTLQGAETPNQDGARTHHRFYWTCDPSRPRAPSRVTAGEARAAPAPQANAPKAYSTENGFRARLTPRTQPFQARENTGQLRRAHRTESKPHRDPQDRPNCT